MVIAAADLTDDPLEGSSWDEEVGGLLVPLDLSEGMTGCYEVNSCDG